MRQLIVRHKVWTAILSLALCFAAYVVCVDDELHGWLAACVDLAHGRYVILSGRSLGQPPPWNAGYDRLLTQRYNVEDREVWVCLENCGWMSDYIDGYNAISMGAIKRKFGRDVFQETAMEASKDWALRHPIR